MLHAAAVQLHEETYHSIVTLGGLKGGGTVVKKAKHTDTERVRRNWQTEVAILRRIVDAPYVTHMVSCDPLTYTIVLRHAPGQTLDKWVDDVHTSTLSDEDASVVSMQMSEALSYLHNAAIVHDDVKPENIVWSADTQQAVLIDFGAAFDIAQLGPDYFTPSGTPPYAPPEYLQRCKGPQGDVWALGVVMLFLRRFCGLPDGEWILPHALEGGGDGKARAEMLAWLEKVATLRTQWPVDHHMYRMLEPDPARRITAPELLVRVRDGGD